MEMRFWKPFPRPDLFEIVTSQVVLLHSVLTTQHSLSEA